MAGVPQPLDQKFPLVKSDGTPTDYFIRWAQQKQIDIGDSITLDDLKTYLTEHSLREGSGIQFTPSGDLNDSPLIAADVQEILDQVTATRGAILYRGLLGWAALLPGTVGYFLQTAGVGADPLWAAASGGGGSSPCPPIRTTAIQANGSVASYVVNLPAGSTAGDFCVIIHGGAFGDANITLPATALWAQYKHPATNWGGTVFTKTLTAVDIAAGSVTITPSGSFNSVASVVVFQGPAQLRYPSLEITGRTAIWAPGAGAAASVQQAPDCTVDDCILVFASNRAASTNTSAYGTLKQTVNAANGSGALYAEENPTAGGNTVNLTYSVAGTGRYETALVVRGPN